MKQVGNKSFKRNLLTAAVLGAVAQAGTVYADAFIDALAKSKVSGNFRLRYEDVNLDQPATPLKDANALTLRSRLGIETAPLSGFTAILEFENTTIVGGDDHYSPEYINPTKRASTVAATHNNPYDYAPIVDPEVTEVNRAYLRYRGISKLDVGLGRQRILLDNQRFVGNVGWRQDEQTYDAFTVNYTAIPNWAFYYGYIDQVNGIADKAPIYNFDLESSDNLINIAYTGLVYGKITAYAYLLDNGESEAAIRNLTVSGDNNFINPALRFYSNDTYGLRFDGNYNLPTQMPLRLLYTAEYAKQELEVPIGAGSVRDTFDTSYSLLDGGIGYVTKLGLVSARYAHEVMGGDEQNGVLRGFQTPYATKHAFNGWDDMFLNTPDSGLVHDFLTFAADLQPYGVKVSVIFHEFEKDKGSGDFGSETDIQVLKQFGANYTVGIKYAAYDADDATTTNFAAANNIDTSKFWVWGELNF